MEYTTLVIGYKELAKILNKSPGYLAQLNSKSPERLPPPTLLSRTKWNIHTVEEWLRENPNRKRKGGRPRNY